MLNRIDKWVDSQTAKWDISTEHYVVRWGIFLVGVSLSLFATALSISFFALSASLWSTVKIVAIIALALGIIGLVKGIFVVLYTVHLADRWLKEGSKDFLATKEDLKQFSQEISKEISSLSKQMDENQTDMVRINAGLILGMKDMTSDLTDRVRTFRKELKENVDDKQ